MVNTYGMHEIADALKCPVPWDEICSDREFAQQLRFMWVYAVSRYQVDGEAGLFHDDFSLDGTAWTPDTQAIELMHSDDDRLRSRLINAETWRPRAEGHYFTAVRWFERLDMATPDEYKKHYAGKRLNDNEVASKSSTSPNGLLYTRCDAEWQRSLAWAALSKEWYTILCRLPDGDDADAESRAKAFEKRFGGNATSIFIQLYYDLGCSRGRGTPFALIKFNFSAPYLAHVNPCFQTDYEQKHTVRYIPYEDLDPPPRA